MKILVLGGTVFVGRHFAEVARDRGHEVTLFHRGSKGAGIVADVDEIFGDRDGGLAALDGKTWDAVVDTCGYVPRVVAQSVESLKDRVGRYVFVSSISVYRFDSPPPLGEDAPKMTMPDETVEDITAETYGALKVLCEDVVFTGFRERGVAIRAGLIAGPYDPTNRFTYWVGRCGFSQPVLVPMRTDAPQQIIDARDLAGFMLVALETGLSGPYNVCGPAEPATFGDMIEACRLPGSDARLFPATEGELKAQNVELWTDLPLVMPFDGSMDAMNCGDNAKALAAGLSLRPLSETARDTWNWLADRPEEAKPRFGMSRQREIEAIGTIVQRRLVSGN